MTDDTYQGWTNRETWCANLWIGNTEPLYVTCREIAQGKGSVFQKIDRLDARMRREIARHDGFVADMLQASFARVNWREILDGLMEA